MNKEVLNYLNEIEESVKKVRELLQEQPVEQGQLSYITFGLPSFAGSDAEYVGNESFRMRVRDIGQVRVHVSRDILQERDKYYRFNLEPLFFREVLQFLGIPAEAKYAGNYFSSMAGTSREYFGCPEFRLRHDSEDETLRFHVAKGFARERDEYIAFDIPYELVCDIKRYVD